MSIPTPAASKFVYTMRPSEEQEGLTSGGNAFEFFVPQPSVTVTKVSDPVIVSSNYFCEFTTRVLSSYR
jgi:hypothetical protein